MAKPPSPHLTPADTDAAYAAAQCVVQTHQRLSEWLREGQTLAQVDQFVAKALEEFGARSAFLGYRIPKLPAFPSHACLSVNACVVHGTAGYYTEPMRRGDVLKVDIGVIYRGWVGDAAWTYTFKEMSPLVKRLTDAGKESLRRGVQQLRPGKTYMDWARAVQGCVEGEHGFHLIRGLGGHGYGRKLHEPPFVSNVLPLHMQEWPDGYRPCEPGTLVAVEPMVAVGTGDVSQKPRQWPVFTADGSLSVHYEHDVLITEKGPRVLTEGMEGLPDVVG